MHSTIGKGSSSRKRHMLKDITVGEVSFVPAGANQGALQAIIKVADEEEFLKRLFNEVLRDFGVREEVDALMCELLKVNSALRESLIEIIRSPEYTDKKDAIKTSLGQFMSAITTMVDDSEVIKGFGDLHKRAMKTEGGTAFPAGDFAYVPDANTPSTWKLRLTSTPGGKPDPRIVGAAVAALGPGFRGNKVQIPSAAKAGVVQRVRRAWLTANPGKGRADLPNVLKSTDQEDQMSKEELEKAKKENDELTAKLAKAELMAGMTDDQKKFHKGLEGDAKEAFEKADSDARDAIIAKANETDEEFDADGVIIKRSEVGAGMFAFMKAQAAKNAKLEADLKKSNEENIQKAYETRAEKELPHLPGTAVEKAEMLKAIDGIPNEDMRKKQMEMLKASDAAMAKQFEQTGSDTTNADQLGANAKLNKMAQDHAAKENIPFAKAYSAVIDTADGKKLYEETLKQ